MNSEKAYRIAALVVTTASITAAVMKHENPVYGTIEARPIPAPAPTREKPVSAILDSPAAKIPDPFEQWFTEFAEPSPVLPSSTYRTSPSPVMTELMRQARSTPVIVYTERPWYEEERATRELRRIRESLDRIANPTPRLEDIYGD